MTCKQMSRLTKFGYYQLIRKDRAGVSLRGKAGRMIKVNQINKESTFGNISIAKLS
ncbi:MAG: hypothetical protein Q4C25_04890 [Bacillota bacterium]|nr:hypothetical protein [Bacillota bacterium]